MRNPDTCDHYMTVEYGVWYCAYCSYGLAEMLAAKDAQKNEAIEPKRGTHLRRIK